jgi:hypothetical protein
MSYSLIAAFFLLGLVSFFIWITSADFLETRHFAGADWAYLDKTLPGKYFTGRAAFLSQLKTANGIGLHQPARPMYPLPEAGGPYHATTTPSAPVSGPPSKMKLMPYWTSSRGNG